MMLNYTVGNVTVSRVDGLDDPDTIIKRSHVADNPQAKEILTRFASLSASVFIGKVGKEIACVWGFIQPSLLSQEAYIWLLTTDLVEENKFRFVRHSQMHVQEMLKHYPSIVGDCVVGDHKAVKWLKLLGATFDEPIGKKIPFCIKAKVHG